MKAFKIFPSNAKYSLALVGLIVIAGSFLAWFRTTDTFSDSVRSIWGEPDTAATGGSGMPGQRGLGGGGPGAVRGGGLGSYGGGPGGSGESRLSPGKARAWTLQAGGVSMALKLGDEELSGKVLEAYMVARKSQQEAMGELRRSSGDGRARFRASQELNQKERSTLSETLNSFLSEEQATQAMASLGAFSETWDRYVTVLTGLGLVDDELQSGLLLLRTHTIDSEKARSEAFANEDLQSMRSKRTELKAKLDSDLAELLSERQLAKWKEQTSAIRGGFGGRGNR